MARRGLKGNSGFERNTPYVEKIFYASPPIPLGISSKYVSECPKDWHVIEPKICAIRLDENQKTVIKVLCEPNNIEERRAVIKDLNENFLRRFFRYNDLTFKFREANFSTKPVSVYAVKRNGILEAHGIFRNDETEIDLRMERIEENFMKTKTGLSIEEINELLKKRFSSKKPLKV